MKTAMQDAVDKIADFWETEQDFKMSEYIYINEILVNLLELEKKQIIDANNSGCENGQHETAEDYYNRKFNK